MPPRREFKFTLYNLSNQYLQCHKFTSNPKCTLLSIASRVTVDAASPSGRIIDAALDPVEIPPTGKTSRVPTVNCTRVLWQEDPQCSRFETCFGPPGSIPMTGIVSYPGSGNSWVRYLIGMQ